MGYPTDDELKERHAMLPNNGPADPSIGKLRDTLNELDDQIRKRIQKHEEWLFTLNAGIPIPLGDDFVYDKLNGKWRLMESGEDGRTMDAIPRDDRVSFVEDWPVKRIKRAVREALLAAITHRKKVLGE